MRLPVFQDTYASLCWMTRSSTRDEEVHIGLLDPPPSHFLRIAPGRQTSWCACSAPSIEPTATFSSHQNLPSSRLSRALYQPSLFISALRDSRLYGYHSSSKSTATIASYRHLQRSNAPAVLVPAIPSQPCHLSLVRLMTVQKLISPSQINTRGLTMVFLVMQSA